MTDDADRRRWHLEAFQKVDGKEERVHNSTCHGDRALDEAMKRLEPLRYGPKKKRLRITVKGL